MFFFPIVLEKGFFPGLSFSSFILSAYFPYFFFQIGLLDCLMKYIFNFLKHYPPKAQGLGSIRLVEKSYNTLESQVF